MSTWNTLLVDHRVVVLTSVHTFLFVVRLCKQDCELEGKLESGGS